MSICGPSLRSLQAPRRRRCPVLSAEAALQAAPGCQLTSKATSHCKNSGVIVGYAGPALLLNGFMPARARRLGALPAGDPGSASLGLEGGGVWVLLLGGTAPGDPSSYTCFCGVSRACLLFPRHSRPPHGPVCDTNQCPHSKAC